MSEKHQWVGHKDPNTSSEFGEWVVYCDNCGAEQDDDNKDEYCHDELAKD